MGTLMIYGATGYTGRLAAEHAAAAGLDLILGGRNTTRLAAQANRLGVSHRAFDLDDDAAAAAALADVAVVLNCAGPFMRTAEPLMRRLNAVASTTIAAKPQPLRTISSMSATSTSLGSWPSPTRMAEQAANTWGLARHAYRAAALNQATLTADSGGRVRTAPCASSLGPDLTVFRSLASAPN
jgi:uncharacterized protein YbjT (DUF2867 family)